MKQPIDIEATIKAAFNGIIETIEKKLEHIKGKKTKQEYATLKSDLAMLKNIAANPKKYFQVNDMPNPKYRLANNMQGLSLLDGRFSPQSIQGVRLLDSLILYTADYYQDKVKRFDLNDNILKINKIIQLGRGSAVIRALNSIRSLAPVEHFAVRNYTK